MSDTQPTRASQNSNTAEYVVVACLFAGLAGALAYGMYISQPDMPPAPARVGAVPAAVATAARACLLYTSPSPRDSRRDLVCR
ncbi:hypothetical protein, partial [Bosea sp. ASV33]|uniref:hypothetical protein n=1 Tax=Bosea sp. ASV33 TaxID=2795106 RepID=UPI0018EAF21A